MSILHFCRGIQIQNLSRNYGCGSILENLNFTLPGGHTLAIIGPSGCGKSTLLALLSGLDKPNSGIITFTLPENHSEDSKDDQSRHIAFVLQDYGLFPWKTVGENLTLPLRLQGASKIQREKALAAILEEMRLNGLEDRYPVQLSGGQRQRVGIGRALITNPDILLMDEPFSSLDALTRKRLQENLLHLWQQRQLTCVLVTHDVPEAIFLGQHILVLGGQPAQIRLWLDNPCFGEAAGNSEQYFAITRQLYTTLSESLTSDD